MSTTARKKNTAKLDIVSSGDSRTRILEAALALITKRGEAGVTMAEIAQAARISRQGLYLHFADRAELLVALVRYLDEKLGLPADIERVTTAPGVAAAIAELVALHARRNPSIWAVAQAVDAVRRTDPAAERSWQDRLDNRLAGCRTMIARIQAEGQLREGLPPDEAADLLWSLTSLRVWEDLVRQRGWTAERYQQTLTRLLLESLTTHLHSLASVKRR